MFMTRRVMFITLTKPGQESFDACRNRVPVWWDGR